MKQIKNTLIRVKNAILYKQGVHFPFSKVRIWALRKLGHHVGKDVYFPADLTITQNFVHSRGLLYIGDRVSIAPDVILTLASHPNASKIRDNLVLKPSTIRIEDDVWIGAGAIILNGITIGEGAVVGAGSVVTHDVEPYTIVAGNPAHKIKDVTSN